MASAGWVRFRPKPSGFRLVEINKKAGNKPALLTCADVLGLIHQQPWQPWTVTELCSKAGLSKTVLSEKFAALIGSSPIEYLSAWRLQIAAGWLMEPGMSVERVAERCGYDSVPAFSKAFKRYFGNSPGAFRRGREANG